MKRFILIILTLVLSLTLFSCNENNVTEKYQVTDLKTLFNAEIPQAAIFVKNGASDEDVAYVVDMIKNNINYLNTNYEEFSKEVVSKHKIFETWGSELICNLLPRAGIKYELNKEDVSRVLTLLGVSNFKDEYYYELSDNKSSSLSEEFKVIVPSGLPFLALSNLIGMTNVTITNVTGTQIPTELAKGEAQIVVAPINAGAKLIGAGKANYKLLSPITFNNAFLVSSSSSKKIESVNDLDGLTIHAFNEAGIPASILKYLFTSNNLNMEHVDFSQESSASIFASYNNEALNDEYILISEPELSKLLNLHSEEAK